jgi:hypothetical protein
VVGNLCSISNANENLPWFDRRRLRRAFDAANNWPPKRPPEMTPATYRVFYSDGICVEKTFVPVEIEGWVARYNNDEGQFASRILSILDEKGGKTIEVVRVRITEAGRKAIKG